MSFDVQNLVPIDVKPDGKTAVKDYNVDNLVPVDVGKDQKTAFERFRDFRESEKETMLMSAEAKGGLDETKGRLNDSKGPVDEKQFNQEFPPTDFLHAIVHMAGDSIYSTFSPALGLAKDAQNASKQDMAEIERDHPIAAIVGAIAPFLATAPLFPQNLVGITSQFGMISGLSELGRQRAQESLMTPLSTKALDVARETSKGALMGPIWHFSDKLNFIGRPFVSAALRAGVRGGGTFTLDKFYGDNVTQSMKDGGLMTAVSLLFESPSLATRAISRGVINKINDMYAKRASIVGLPEIKINPDDIENYPKPLESSVSQEFAKKEIDKMHVKEISDLLSVSDSPGYLVDNGEGGYQRLGTGWPTFLANRGYDRNELNNIFNKFIRDKELTGNQQEILNKVLEDSKPFTEGLNGFQKKILTAVSGLSHDVPGNDKPQITSAAIRLPDEKGQFSDQSQVIEGSDHESALNKIGMSKDTMKEVKSPEIRLQDIPDTGMQRIVDQKGREIGQVTKSTEDFKIDIADEFQGQGYGVGTIAHIFNKGAESISGDVGKANLKAQLWWASVGGKLTPTESGNFKLYLSKKDFQDKTLTADRYQSGFKTLHPDGKSDFITRAQSMDEPYNLPNGYSSDVPGLNEQAWVEHPEPPKPVNTATKSLIPEGEEGKIDVAMLPGVPELAYNIKRFRQEMIKTFVPPDVSDVSKFTGMTMRQWLGINARNTDRFFNTMHQAFKLFDKASKESITESYTKSQHGESTGNKNLDEIYDFMKQVLSDKADEYEQAVGRDIKHIDDYLAHIWENPRKAKDIIDNAMARILGKRPLGGGKAFLKKRVIADFAEGIKAGLTPVSWNPVELTMLKLREIDRALLEYHVRNALRDRGFEVFHRVGTPRPDGTEGWVKIKDKASDVYYKNDAKELVLSGHWVTHPDAARIINNYLTPGLRGNYFYDIWRAAGNSLVQARLSLSAFHGQFVSNDANVSHFALGLQKLIDGDLKGFQNIGMSMSPGLPVINPGAIQTFLEGRKMMESWNGKDNGQITNMMAELYARGGGRAKMDKFYALESDRAIAKALKEGKLLTGALHTPFWLLQQFNKPLLEHYVPIMKMGVFSNLMKYELERNPDISMSELLDRANKAVDAVDDRMGQLVYDNLFISRTLKDLGMASVQSLGWNIGDVRLFGGGAVDAVKSLNDLRQGKSTEMSYRVAYVLAMPMVIGWYGAIYQYLHTGKYPGQGIEDQGLPGVLKDLYFPRNGGFDPNGQESRSTLASYVKDIYHFAIDPVRTIIDKLNPVGSSVINQFQNRNFYGVQIVDPNDTNMKQFLDRVSDTVAENFPYSIQNAQRNPNRSFENKAENFIGFNMAPYDINMTRAEREAHKMAVQNIPIAPRSKEAAQKSQAEADIRSQYLALKQKEPADAQALLKDAVDDGKITEEQRKNIEKESEQTNLQRLTKNLRYDQVYYLLKFANEQERQDIEDILSKKEKNLKRRGSWTDQDEKLLEEQTAVN